MLMCGEFEIRELPLMLKSVHDKVEAFLKANGLRMEKVDEYAAVYALGEEEILAGGGLAGDTIKCVAVCDALRGSGMGAKLISYLVCKAAAKGHSSVKVFTKPDNQSIFTSLGFKALAASPHAVFMENGSELDDYCRQLRVLRREGTCGIIVMNANPFTKGHRYVVEQSAKRVDHLYVMVVREDQSRFSYEERRAMVTYGCSDLKNVTVCDGSRYAVSADTFPTYFLKRIDDATDEQIILDLNLFARHLAPALGASVRFVGSEPIDELTRRYNQLMQEMLPEQGIAVVEIERLRLPSLEKDTFGSARSPLQVMGQHVPALPESDGDEVVSASRVRQYVDARRFLAAASIAYPTTIPFIIAELATEALHDEIDTTPKPGLVDKADNGAHDDMDYPMMYRSIRALRPYFVRLARCGFQAELPSFGEINAIGLEAEQAMFHSTHGVNTYKGALFSMGLAIVAAAHTYFNTQTIYHDALRRDIAALAVQFPVAKGTHGEEVLACHQVAGARACACEAYPKLFEVWLPFFASHFSDPYCFHKTLLLIMSTLDDTNLFYRGGAQAVERIRARSAALLDDFSIEGLEQFNRQMISDHLSPGGSADMLSLTSFIHSLH